MLNVHPFPGQALSRIAVTRHQAHFVAVALTAHCVPYYYEPMPSDNGEFVVAKEHEALVRQVLEK